MARAAALHRGVLPRRSWVLMLVLAAVAWGSPLTTALRINDVVDCPETIVTPEDGSTLTIQANTTYQLSAGTYTLNTTESTIYPTNEGDKTGVCIVGLEDDRSQVQVEVKDGWATSGLDLGLQGVTFSGIDSGKTSFGSGMGALFGRSLGVNDVEFAHFTGHAFLTIGFNNINITSTRFVNSSASYGGAGGGLILSYDFFNDIRPQAFLDKVDFINCSAPTETTGYGGGLDISGAAVVLRSARFIGCSAWTGGALGIEDFFQGNVVTIQEATFEDCFAYTNGGALAAKSEKDTTVNLDGTITMSGCRARNAGGAIHLDGSRATITGALCGQNNSANEGGFAAVTNTDQRTDARLNIAASATVSVGANSPETSTVNAQRGAIVICGPEGSPAWDIIASSDYAVQGPLCGCTTAFEAGTSNTCDACGASGWDADTCACATVNPEECTAGVCCDVTNKTFLADGTECAYDPLESDAFAPFRRAKVNDAHASGGAGNDFYYYYPYARDAHNNREHTHDDDDNAPSHYRDAPYYSGGRRASHDPYTPPNYYPDGEEDEWPMCFGACSLGQCVLDKKRSGCCYVARKGEYDESDGYGGYAKQLSSTVASSVAGGYKEGRRRENLLCWKSAHDYYRYGDRR